MKSNNYTIENCTRMFAKIKKQYPLMQIRVAITDVKNSQTISVMRV